MYFHKNMSRKFRRKMGSDTAELKGFCANPKAFLICLMNDISVCSSRCSMPFEYEHNTKV